VYSEDYIHKIFEVTGTTEICVSIPYLHPAPYICVDQNFAVQALGLLTVHLITPPSSFDSTSSSTIWMTAFQACSPDDEWRGLGLNSNFNIVPAPFASDIEPQGLNDFSEAFPSLIESKLVSAPAAIGSDTATSFAEILRRYYPAQMSGVTLSNFNTYAQGKYRGTGSQLTGAGAYNYVASCFLGGRGSYRFYISSSSAIRFHVSASLFETFPIAAPSVHADPNGSDIPLNVEIPFYNQLLWTPFYSSYHTQIGTVNNLPYPSLTSNSTTPNIVLTDSIGDDFVFGIWIASPLRNPSITNYYI